MENKEKEALILVLNNLETVINVSRKNALGDCEFEIDVMSTALTDVLNALRGSLESIEVSELLTSISEYYKPLEKRDAIEAGEYDDRQEIKWFLRRRDEIKAQIKELKL